ncbi:MAG: glycosyltransferase [Pirellulales bacterium]
MPRESFEVAVVCEYPTILGGERSMLALVARLQAEGVVLRAVVPAGKLAEAWAAAGVDVASWTAGRNEATGRRDRGRAASELAEKLALLRPQLVHANSLSMGRLVGPVARRCGIASLAHLRDIVGLSGVAIADLNQNVRLLAVSEATRRFHVAAGVDAARTHVLHNGVDLDAFRPTVKSGWLHRELGLPAETLLVGVVGQISLRKGWDILLAAAEQVLGQTSDIAFVLVGGRYSDKAETRAIEKLLDDASREFEGRLFWLGERDDVQRILPELAALAHAARQEPLGRVLLEAAAAGVAIVATDVGGTSEIFPPTLQAAILVPAGDPTALAASLLELLSSEQRRVSLGSAARTRAVDAFGADAAAAALLRHYREVAGAGA